MSDEREIEQFAKDPALLVQLCRQVIGRLDDASTNTDVLEKEAQLREISRSIERLEKAGVAVPDVLRAEKTRLVVALGIQTESSHALGILADAFDAISSELKARLGRGAENTSARRPRSGRPRSPKTSHNTLRLLITEALKLRGGSAKKNDILKDMEQELQGKLLPGDLEWRAATNDYAWQNNACWERYQMAQEGILKRDSPKGIWELSEDQR